MDKVVDETFCGAGTKVLHGEEKPDWTQYSQMIADTIADKMGELGLSQRKLAEKMGCTQQYVCKVLKGRENMSLETICKIENTLGVEILSNLNKQEL